VEFRHAEAVLEQNQGIVRVDELTAVPKLSGVVLLFVSELLLLLLLLLSSTLFLRPTRVSLSNGISIGLAVFTGLTNMTNRQTRRQTTIDRLQQ